MFEIKGRKLNGEGLPKKMCTILPSLLGSARVKSHTPYPKAAQVCCYTFVLNPKAGQVCIHTCSLPRVRPKAYGLWQGKIHGHRFSFSLVFLQPLSPSCAAKTGPFVGISGPLFAASLPPTAVSLGRRTSNRKQIMMYNDQNHGKKETTPRGMIKNGKETMQALGPVRFSSCLSNHPRSSSFSPVEICKHAKEHKFIKRN